jgi:hypothetical protein
MTQSTTKPTTISIACKPHDADGSAYLSADQPPCTQRTRLSIPSPAFANIREAALIGVNLELRVSRIGRVVGCGYTGLIELSLANVAAAPRRPCVAGSGRRSAIPAFVRPHHRQTCSDHGSQARGSRAAQGERDLAQGIGVLCADGPRPPTSEVIAFIDARRDRDGVRPICKVLPGNRNDNRAVSRISQPRLSSRTALQTNR